MTWFSVVFPFVMILFPAVFVTLYPAQPGAAAADVEAGLRRTWAGTLVASLVAGAVLASAPGLWQGVWCLFFPLWFGLAMKVWVAKNPGLQPSSSPLRSASLVNREQVNPVPPSAWLVHVAVLAGTAPALGDNVLAWGIWSGGLLWLGLAPVAASKLVQEPEPLAPVPSPELEAAYAALRSFKAWGFFWASLLALALFAACGGVIAAGVPLAAAWIGGVGGTLVGIGGGVFGTVADVRRARVANLRRSLEGG